MQKIKALLHKLLTREFILYVVFGLLTTAISVLSYQLFESRLGMHYALANILSWVLAVTFAYVTNKFFVFQAHNDKKSSLFLEMILFYAARLFSLAIEEGGLFLLIDLVHMDGLWAKLILQVVVVILNYVLSKLIIFRKKNAADGK